MNKTEELLVEIKKWYRDLSAPKIQGHVECPVCHQFGSQDIIFHSKDCWIMPLLTIKTTSDDIATRVNKFREKNPES